MIKRLLPAVLLLAPRGARACAVCFGAPDGKNGFYNGLWWGIVLLLSVTMLLVGAIGWALWSVERRRRAEGV